MQPEEMTGERTMVIAIGLASSKALSVRDAIGIGLMGHIPQRTALL